MKEKNERKTFRKFSEQQDSSSSGTDEHLIVSEKFKNACYVHSYKFMQLNNFLSITYL